MNFKKRLCKTFAVLGACMLLAGAVVSFPATNVSAQAVTSEEKTIDMYLIAGQSNAAGYSSKDATQRCHTEGGIDKTSFRN